MRLVLLAQLEPVLDGAQEHVRVAEAPDVAPFDVSTRRQLRERDERGGRPDLRIVAAVDELEQLHGELDVADPAAAPLELAIAQALAVELRFGARLHRAHFADRVGVEDVAPHERRGSSP